MLAPAAMVNSGNSNLRDRIKSERTRNAQSVEAWNGIDC